MRHEVWWVAAMVTLAACSGSSKTELGAGDDAAAVGEACEAAATRTGEATYYDADGSGNCSFEPIPGDFMVAALNDTDYGGAAACGACARVQGPAGSAVVRIVDRCPGCGAGDIDLSITAFSAIAELSAGRIDVTWSLVPCDVSGGIAVHFKDGSNAFWTALQVRNHRHPIAQVTARASAASFEPMARANYNYFIAEGGLGEGPYDVRVTDVHGHVVDLPALDGGDDVVRQTDVQLPACRQ